jgi:hypothetical protein
MSGALSRAAIQPSVFRSCVLAALLASTLLESTEGRAAEPPAPSPPVAPVAPAAPTPEVPPAQPGPPPPPGSPATSPPSTAEAATPPVTGTEPARPNVAPDEAQLAPESEVTSGAGLFEQSQSSELPTTTAAESAGANAFELNGYVRGDVFVGKVPGFSQGDIKAAYGELALKVQARPQAYGDAFAELRLRHGLQGETRDLIVDLREAYVNAYLGVLDLRVGHQIIVWGRADAFNPTNNLTPVDLRVRSPVEDDRRIGNVGARAFVKLAPVRIEGVWMPLYAASELPSVVLPEYVTLSDPDYPDPELTKGLGAGRVHLELPAFEMSVSYLYGYAPLPGLALESFTTLDPPEVRIARTAYDHHVAGFDFSTAIGEELAIRGEAAYRHPLDHENRVYAPRPDLQYVLGLDRAFGSVNVILQYVGRYVFDWQDEDGPDDPVTPDFLANLPDEPGPFVTEGVTTAINEELAARNQILFAQTAEVQHLVSARVEWVTLHDTLSLSALGLVNITSGEWLVYPKVGYRLSDALSASLGAEIYAGPDDTLLGLIEEELSAVYAELRFGF